MKILLPSDNSIQEAADSLNRGDLIGLPTETVYGIAAVATNREAVLRTFELKRRPSGNPLIVHVSSMDQVEYLVTAIPEFARRLGEAFWPGPLTIVLPKSSTIPPEVTGGLETVAVRIPSHKVARLIIEATGAPLSAPSANLFMALSPTLATHIALEILEGLSLVIDGGPCDIGLESTVVDCAESVPTILRPGGISRQQIEAVVGAVSVNLPLERRAPGSYLRHYSPRTPFRLVDRLGPSDAGIVLTPPQNDNQIELPREPSRYGSMLYRTLFTLDQRGLAEILTEWPPLTPEWEAVWDRLRKAAG